MLTSKGYSSLWRSTWHERRTNHRRSDISFISKSRQSSSLLQRQIRAIGSPAGCGSYRPLWEALRLLGGSIKRRQPMDRSELWGWFKKRYRGHTAGTRQQQYTVRGAYQWVTKYKVSYSNTRVVNWRYVQDLTEENDMVRLGNTQHTACAP